RRLAALPHGRPDPLRRAGQGPPGRPRHAQDARDGAAYGLLRAAGRVRLRTARAAARLLHAEALLLAPRLRRHVRLLVALGAGAGGLEPRAERGRRGPGPAAALW